MSDTKVRVRKATALLKEDHQRVKKLFTRFEKLDASRETDKTELFDQIKKELTVHAQIEEEIFYPAVEGAQDEDADDLVREAREEHRIVKTLLEELSDRNYRRVFAAAQIEALSILKTAGIEPAAGGPQGIGRTAESPRHRRCRRKPRIGGARVRRGCWGGREQH